MMAGRGVVRVAGRVGTRTGRISAGSGRQRERNEDQS